MLEVKGLFWADCKFLVYFLAILVLSTSEGINWALFLLKSLIRNTLLLWNLDLTEIVLDTLPRS